MIYLELESALSDQPLTGKTTTSADFPKVMDLMDALGEWSLISTTADAKLKQQWASVYMLPRNRLVLVDDLLSAAKDSTLVSRCLNTCRLWVAAGGVSFWINAGQLHDASGTNAEFHRRCAEEAINEALAG